MTNQPNNSERVKEIRLFGEKSIREEAYRQKILQLEQEMERLETMARGQNLPDEEIIEHHEPITELNVPKTQIQKPLQDYSAPKISEPAAQKKEKAHEGFDPHYYETLLSFDKRFRKEQEIFEKRSAEISDRLDAQAQRLIASLDAYFRRKIKLLIFSLFGMAAFLALLGFIIVVTVRLSAPNQYRAAALESKSYFDEVRIARDSVSFIKSSLETQTRYRHQYAVKYVDIQNGIYVAELELNFAPTNKWYLNNLCMDVVEVFKKYAPAAPAEISFLYRGKLYTKAYLTGSPLKEHLQYLY